jgi:ornithine lipid ester-linked acyl 2-hydroxylase
MIALVAVVIIGLLLLMYYCKSKPESKLLTDKDGGYAGIKDCYFDQKKYYPELDIITKNFEVIRQELFSIREKRPDMWHEWIAGELKVFPILFFEKWAKIAEELCPITTNIIKSIPGVKTANFSCLSPNKQIQPHKGWGDLANNILRCHFGLDVPEDCACVCDNWVVKHKTGEWLVFDDSRMHSSYNFSDSFRFILIIDMPRPPGIPKGTSNVKYGDNLMAFIQSFYEADDVASMKKGLGLI